MANGRYAEDNARLQKRKRAKWGLAFLGVILILSLAVGGTLAYVVTETAGISNQFIPAYVTCQVNTTTDGTFDVKNTGNVDAFIRATIVVNWMDDSGNVRGIAPSASDYTLEINSTNWRYDNATGYYYYVSSVSPGALTDKLITAYGLAANVTAPAGYTLSVEVVAEAIQAEGNKDSDGKLAVEDAWGVTFYNSGN